MDLIQLAIEYIDGLKVMIYARSSPGGGHDHFYNTPFIYFTLQTTLDNKIFLQIRTDGGLTLDLNQEEALFFLESLLECGGYYTCYGKVPYLSEREFYCDESYINIKGAIQEIWDLRERILYWLSYGCIGGDFNEVNGRI